MTLKKAAKKKRLFFYQSLLVVLIHLATKTPKLNQFCKSQTKIHLVVNKSAKVCVLTLSNKAE